MHSLRRLWSWHGEIERIPYLIMGITLCLLKYFIDWLIAAQFGRSWKLFHYWMSESGNPVTALSPDETILYGTLVVASLPFIWIGTTLTLQRLRSAGLPLWLVWLFFIPFINLMFFIILSFVPPHASDSVGESAEKHPAGILYRMIPHDRTANWFMAVLLPLPAAFGLTLLAVYVFGQYGWGLFVGIPFAMGLYSALICGFHEPRGWLECMGVSAASLCFWGAGLLFLAMEGIICLLMAFPAALAVNVLGATIGYVLQAHPRNNPGALSTVLVMILAMPFLMGAESRILSEPPLYRVVTTIEIATPPEQVWQHVIRFSDLPPPTEWLFKVGIAYPVRARIVGEGVGACRYCEFSTGSFVEPIEVWDEPHLLRFGVTDNPPPMQEISFYRHLHPPHLEGFLVAKRGQFRLTPLPGGRTRLEGTTWYHHNLYPAFYWRLWSDAIIHRIHWRVLKHIRTQAEHK